MAYDEQWWRENQTRVKSLLTRAEKAVSTDPARALAVAEQVLRWMEEHGWPDWWSRVERLQQDALLNRRLIDSRL